MPLYEYQCEKCDSVFEVMQKFSDEPLTTHEGCGGSVRRLLSSPALQFKGTGWYVTDYARGKGATNGKGGSADTGASKSESKTESKTETKPDTKADTKPAKT